MRRIDFHTLHCSASSQRQTVDTILRYHRDTLGWSVPGYHNIVEPDGTIHEVLKIETPSNGVKGFNAHNINTCYIGGVEMVKSKDIKGRITEVVGKPLDNRTPQQRSSVLKLVIKYNEMFPTAVIQGHRDFSVDKNRDGIITPDEWMKACPSHSVKEWLREINFKSSAPVKYFRTTSPSVNIRAGAGIEFPKVTNALPMNTRVKMLGIAGDWTFVELYNTEIVGWIKSQYISS
jgi:N-acetylmuramoyl-L-alanine amidase